MRRGWAQQAKRTAADGGAGDCFGAEGSISGETALVGAYGDDSKDNDAGAAYVFTRSNGVWTQQPKIVPDDGGNDLFGGAVSLAGEMALVGARGDSDAVFLAGAAYFMTLNTAVAGAQGIGLYDPVDSRFYLNDTPAGGNADRTFGYGPGNAGWTPLSGDWDSNGHDGVGLYNPVLSRFYLKDGTQGGNAEVTVGFGPSGAGWTPLAGDWDGDGSDGIDLYMGSAGARLRGSGDEVQGMLDQSSLSRTD